MTPNDYGISDPRVSRTHARIDLDAARRLRVTALGINPLAVFSAAAEVDAPPQLLRRGDSCGVAPGDEVQLVVEHLCANHGGEHRWMGNACAYLIFTPQGAGQIGPDSPGDARASPGSPGSAFGHAFPHVASEGDTYGGTAVDGGGGAPLPLAGLPADNREPSLSSSSECSESGGGESGGSGATDEGSRDGGRRCGKHTAAATGHAALGYDLEPACMY